MPKTVTKLYAEFEAAVAVCDAHPYPHDNSKPRAWRAALTKADKLCDRLIATPANPAAPIPEMLLKIAAAGWQAGAWSAPMSTSADNWTWSANGGELQGCLFSLRDDLKAMAAQPGRRRKAIKPRDAGRDRAGVRSR